jgi:hypothetical protein
MADSATIDGGEAIDRVLRHVRCNIEVAHVGLEASRIEALVGPHGDALGVKVRERGVCLAAIAGLVELNDPAF